MAIKDGWWYDTDISESEAIANGWFSEKVMPFFQFHKNEVYSNAMDRAAEDFGPLLDTCREGSECRVEKRRIMMENLRKEWKKTIDAFKVQVQKSLSWSEDEIVKTYGELVKCEELHPCCGTAKEVVVNWYKQITTLWSKIHDAEREIAILQTKVTEIEMECPDVVTPEEPEEPEEEDRDDRIKINAELAFTLADSDNNDMINLTEFNGLYKTLTLPNDAGQANAQFLALDENLDGLISYEEFVSIDLSTL